MNNRRCSEIAAKIIAMAPRKKGAVAPPVSDRTDHQRVGEIISNLEMIIDEAQRGAHPDWHAAWWYTEELREITGHSLRDHADYGRK